MTDLPIVFLSCRIFETLLACHLPAGYKYSITFLDYGLHSVPKKLNKSLQAEIDSIPTPSLIVLGYGMCGNALNGIQAGIHTLLMPRTEDCIAIFLGSDETYRTEFNAHPGTYYLTGGWLESGSDPLKEYETYIPKYGKKTADFVMDTQYKNYTRLALVGYSHEDLSTYRERALRVANYCKRWNMTYLEILGSEKYIHRLVEVALDLSKADEAFRVVRPGGKIE